MDALAVAAIPAFGVVADQNGLAEGDDRGHVMRLVMQASRFRAELFGLAFVAFAPGFLSGFVVVHDGDPFS